MEQTLNIYEEHGYKSRKDYLESLAEDYDVSIALVFALADLYGPEEDFDGLLTTLDDVKSMW